MKKGRKHAFVINTTNNANYEDIAYIIEYGKYTYIGSYKMDRKTSFTLTLLIERESY